MFKYIICILVLFISSGSNSETLKQQLERVQRELNDLSKVVYGNQTKKNLNGTSDPENNILTAFDLRLYDLEKDIKKINENFEELIFEIDDLKKLFENFETKVNEINIIKNQKK